MRERSNSRTVGVTLPLVARTADHDSRCSLCDGVILGYDGKRSASEVVADVLGGRDSRPMHPSETLDEIVRVDGAWVHADCAETAGHEVRR